MKYRSRASHNTGFTLIELLVVAGIIALLSSIVLSSFVEVRRKARNTSRLTDVVAYSKAAESYQVSARKYPDGGLNWASPANNYVCLGRASSNSNCFGGSYTGNDALNAQFATEMQSLPPGSDTDVSLAGYGYRCEDTACTQYRILYQLEGVNEKCAGGLFVSNVGTNTYCEIIQCSGGKKPTRTGSVPYTCQ